MRRALTMAAGIAFLALMREPGFCAQLLVTQFGAVPNDAGDDTAAIQSALNAAVAGDTVYLPAGTYRISAALHPASNTVMAGAGQDQTLLLSQGSNSDAMIVIGGVSNVEITDLTLDGNFSPALQSGITASNGAGDFLHRLTIKNQLNPNGSIGIWFVGAAGNTNYVQGANDSVISDNTVLNISTNSIWGTGIRLSWGASRDRILRNTVSETGRGGILANDGAQDLVIQHNVISGSGRAGTNRLGIEAWNHCDRAVIEDNALDHWLSVGGSDNVAVRRNTIQDLTGTVDQAAFIGLEMIGKNLVATDNLIDHNQQLGISISNDYGNQYQFMAYNTVQYMRSWGIQIEGDTAGATNLYFYKNKFQNTLRNQGSSFAPADGPGFRFNENVHGVTLESNTISVNQLDGLQFSSNVDQVAVLNNTMADNAGQGVSNWAGADLEWSGNTVLGNGGGNGMPAASGFTHGKPTADFSIRGSNAGQPVQFTNESTDPSGPLAHVLWDFNDGTPSTDVNPTHVYASTGTYRVTLIGWNAFGRAARQEKTVQITPGAAQGITQATANLVNVKVYPNPWRSDKYAGRFITFEGLVTGTTLKIFTVSGHKVRELHSDSVSLSWDLTNDTGEKVGSGIYLYRITDAQGDAIQGKLAIVK